MKDGKKSLEAVSLAILEHFDRLDKIEDSASETAVEAVKNSRGIAMSGHVSATQNLAEVDPIRATEINIRAIQGRLNRAEAEAAKGNGKGLEDALQEYEELRRFGEEISNEAKEKGQDNRPVNEMNARATENQLESLGSIYDEASQETKSAVEKAVGVAVEEHGKAVKGLQQQGAGDDIPAEPSLPDNIPHNVKKKIEEPESDNPGNGRR
jgi:hypothetical protein